MADIKIQDATTTTHAALDNKIPVYDGTLAPTTITPEQILEVGIAGGVVAAALGADENYVTDAEKVKLANLSTVDLTALNAHLTNTSDPHQTTFDQLSGTLSKLPMNTSLPTQTLSAGEMAWNPDERCFDMGVNGVTLQAGQEFLIHVRNSTGTTINNGTVCMAVGTIGASGRITVAPMDGTNSANSMRLLGLATEDIIAGQDGFVTAIGKVRGVDTSAWSEGDVLYTSTTVIGGLTNIAPTTGLKQPIAYVVTDHASVGTLFVRIETLDHLAFEPANTNIQAHISSTSNPHSVTYSQVGAEPANANIQSHISSTSNPHSVTKTQVGLGNVLNAEQEVVSAKGQALGYCPLDGSAKVAEAYLPDSVLGQVEYQGVWNATTNTPAIPTASTANKGWYYIVSVSGTTTIDGISEWTIGDWIISNGTAWTKIDNTDSVSSVFGRAGAIVANAGDYTASQVTNVPAGNISATTVQAAINELDTEKASTTDGRFVTNGDNHDHVGGDGAAITEGALSFSDVTTSNVSTSRHGLMPKTYSNSVVVTDTSGVVGYLAAGSGGLPLVSQVGSYPVFAALSLSGLGVTGVLPITNGGTGSSTQNFVDLTTNQTVGGNKSLTGTTSIPLGTAAAPSLTVGNTGNGVFSPATNTVGIATAGVQRVGIADYGLTYTATGANSAKLRASASGTGTAELTLDASDGDFAGGDYFWIRQNNDLTTEITQVGSYDLLFKTANTERTRITSTGNLLVGATIDAGTRMYVAGLSASSYSPTSLNADQASITIGNGQTTVDDAAAHLNLIVTGATGSSGATSISCLRTGDGAAAMAFRTKFAGVMAERARITSAGALLINATTSPLGTATLWTQGLIGATNIQTGYTGYSAYSSISVNRSEQSGVGQTDKVAIDVGSGSGAARFLHLNVDAGTIGGDYTISRDGTHKWNQGSSSTERMRITSTGALLVGRTTETTIPKLQVGFANPAASPTYTANVDVAVFNSLGAAILQVQGPTSSGIGFSSDTVRSAGYIGYTHSTNTMSFRTDTQDRMFLFPDGNLSIGNGTNQGYKLYVNGTTALSGNVGVSVLPSDLITLYVNKTTASAETTGIHVLQQQTVAGSNFFGADLRAYSAHTTGTLANQYGVRSVARATGSGGTITTLYGFYSQVDAPSGTPIVGTAVGFAAGDISVGATNTYGFLSNISTGTGKWNLYSVGTANNYLAGTTLIGSPAEHPNPAKTQITSTILGLSVKADTADTARFWRPVNTVSAAAGRILFGGYVDTSTYGDYASIGAIIENSALATKAGAIAFSSATGGTLTEKARITASGNLLIGTSTDPGYGSKIHSTAGISLGNTAVANGNVLDWYEEGTFTPVVQGSTTAGVGTYSSQTGTFTRIGNRVFFNIKVDWTAHTGTGNINIVGLPYASTEGNTIMCAISASSLTFTGQLAGNIANNTAYIAINSFASGGAITNVGMDTAAVLYINGSYKA